MNTATDSLTVGPSSLTTDSALSEPAKPGVLQSALDTVLPHQPRNNSIRNSQFEISNGSPDPQLSTASPPPTFPRSHDETPRAYSAFIAFYQLGRRRSLQGVANQCKVSIDTIKKWSSKFDWKNRIQSFNTAILENQIAIEAALQREQVARWSARMATVREQQWIAAQKLLTVVECYLENFSDEQLAKMTLSQATRALVVASQIGRSAIAGFGPSHSNASALSHSQTVIAPPKPSEVRAQIQRPNLDGQTATTSAASSSPLTAHHSPSDKNVSVTERAEKCRAESTDQTSAPAEVLKTGLDAHSATSTNVCFSSLRHHHPQYEKKVSAVESAEKCHVESNSEDRLAVSHPSPCPTPVPAINSRSWIYPLAACPSRGIRRTQKIISGVKSAKKCRLCPAIQSGTRPGSLPLASMTCSGTRPSSLDYDFFAPIQRKPLPPNSQFNLKIANSITSGHAG